LKRKDKLNFIIDAKIDPLLEKIMTISSQYNNGKAFVEIKKIAFKRTKTIIKITEDKEVIHEDVEIPSDPITEQIELTYPDLNKIKNEFYNEVQKY